MLSIICAYNKSELMENLKESLQKQKNISYEYIPIDAQSYGFKSASETLNFAGKKARGEYLIFTHQDVVFEEDDCLKKIEDWCKENKFGIAGVAGCVNQKGKSVMYSNIYHGKSHEKACDKKIVVPKEVESLDECLLIVPQRIFKNYQFSNIGESWHLYGTDYVLKMKMNGYKSFVLPVSIWHLSQGASMNIDYYESIYSIARLYKKQMKTITTIYGVWPTDIVSLGIKCIYRKLRFLLKGR